MRNIPFFATLTVGTILSAGLAAQCFAELSSGADPQQVTASFDKQLRWLTRLVPIVAVGLVAMQSLAYRQRRARGWLFLVCWLYFAVFTAVDYIWLTELIFQHTQDTGTWEGGFNAMGILGAALIAAFGLVCGAGYVFAKDTRRVKPIDGPND